ncbi:MAG: DEAD/DEAH box helicase family protein [Chloroflexota bacterium]
MLALKEYQQQALTALQSYCQLAAQFNDVDTAYYQLTRQTFGRGIPYNPITELPGMPYVCIRIPTGGGKTLVAAHAIPILKQELLQGDHPLVLWLVPSNAILDQTIAALNDRKHPYRRTLETQLGAVQILNVRDALYVQRPSLDSHTTILVSTIQAFRVEDTEGRKVYETNGNLMGHFDGYPDEALDQLEKWEDGKVKYSLANVIKLRRPLVIVDEAHNARTSLSFTTLARFAPSAILELTATPDTEENPSNVIYSASAAQLHAEDMIKMPIMLETLPDWKGLLSNAIAQRDQLEQIAKTAAEEYIRPIMLLQAEANRGATPITVEVLEQTLLEDFKIPANQIARATGTERGLDGVDIAAKDCPIRYVITVQALREGWDCPFAYVLCSVAEMHSSTAVEQMLGRIMRLPYACRQQDEALNQAYAFSASANFMATADALADGLVQNGFERLDAEKLIIGRQAHPEQTALGPLLEAAALAKEVVSLGSTDLYNTEKLPINIREKVTVNYEVGTVTFQGRMSEAERDALIEHIPQAKAQITTAYQQSQKYDRRTPSQKRILFSLPRLAYKQGNLLEELDKTHYLEHRWQLSQKAATLDETEFPSQQQRGQQAHITISQAERVEVKFLQNLHQQMSFLARDKGWTHADLVYWLDRAVPHPDIVPSESGAFLNKLVQNLIDQRGFSLDQLVHDKYRLAAVTRKKIDEYRQHALNQAFQQFLIPNSPIVVTPDLLFTFDTHRYPYNTPYRGTYTFQKHYYPDIGAMNGEEADCARYIDTLEEVEMWVRNPERSSKAFSLQTSSDKFYPDFVCKLKKDRYLIIEYKGEDRKTNEDSREKESLGQLYEKRSNGKCLFIMITNKNYAAISAKINTKLQVDSTE